MASVRHGSDHVLQSRNFHVRPASFNWVKIRWVAWPLRYTHIIVLKKFKNFCCLMSWGRVMHKIRVINIVTGSMFFVITSKYWLALIVYFLAESRHHLTHKHHWNSPTTKRNLGALLSFPWSVCRTCWHPRFSSHDPESVLHTWMLTHHSTLPVNQSSAVQCLYLCAKLSLFFIITGVSSGFLAGKREWRWRSFNSWSCMVHLDTSSKTSGWAFFSSAAVILGF